MKIQIPCAYLRRAGKSVNTQYSVRFNVLCTPAFKGSDLCLVKKTDNGRFIIIAPNHGEEPTNRRIYSAISTDGGGVAIHLTRYVNSGFIPESVFGKRYKVKRDRKGQIYICLDYPLEDGTNE